MILIPLVFSLCLISNVDYGETYVEETSSRTLPLISLETSYALDLDDSFNDLHSLTAKGQVRLWKYLSTGVFYHHLFPHLSQAGGQLDDLEPALVVSIPQPRWGLFSLTELQFLIGDWNILNLFPLQADLLLGAGVGVLSSRPDVDAKDSREISYLWSVGQRFRFYKGLGLAMSIFGHRGGSFISGGLSAAF